MTDQRLDLPAIASFSEDEELLARVTVGIVRGGGAMFTGRFLECVVARLLDAEFPVFGTSPWDLILRDGTRVGVRSGAKSFSLKGSTGVDVWIFVHKLERDEPFSVVTSEAVAALGGRSISNSKIDRLFGRVGPSDLAATVALHTR